jgi:hypothetical protein
MPVSATFPLAVLLIVKRRVDVAPTWTGSALESLGDRRRGRRDAAAGDRDVVDLQV